MCNAITYIYVVHIYFKLSLVAPCASIDVMADPDMATCNKYSDAQLGQSCWSWAGDLKKADTCQQKLTNVMGTLNSVCCPKGGCKSGLPKTCNEKCAALWLPIWEDCSHTYQTAQYQSFSSTCEKTKYGQNRCNPEYMRKAGQSLMSGCKDPAALAFLKGTTQTPPKTCGRTCKNMLLPFYNECHGKLPASFDAFVGICQGGHGH